MENLHSALPMGQYGAYVWSSFIAVALIMFIMMVGTLRALRRAEKQLKSLQHTNET